MLTFRFSVTGILRGMCFLALCSPAAFAESNAFRDEVEADWLLQDQYRTAAPSTPATTETDAKGGCDGVIDGKWGFHTNCDENPWWQVDLGCPQPLDRVVCWNRCDAAARNDKIQILLSMDDRTWTPAYQHNGPTFYGFPDKKPLSAPMNGQTVRFVRVALPGKDYLHMDEVEVFSAADPAKNVALKARANQSSVSTWSSAHGPARPPVDTAGAVGKTVKRCRELLVERRAEDLHVRRLAHALESFERRTADLPAGALDESMLREVRWIQRKLLLMDPLLNFDALLFAKHVPGSFNHMSDQHYGWWSRPGGGVYLLKGFKEDAPEQTCLSEAFTAPGSFMRPSLSFDGKKVLFAHCTYYPGLAENPDKLNKGNVPEDAFYHVFEMNIDGTGLRQLTKGKYDDFDARYLPDGRIVFLSTRRGQAVQCGADTAARTLETPDLPDCYVRCGGGPERPVAVYTLHTMNRDGGELNAISPFEMFEWTPSVSRDGTILYSRWDYIDRWNMPYMSLWSIHPDGTNTRVVYKNYTLAPHCTFEPQSIPGSNKIVFTGSAHHAQTMGSLVLLDPAVNTEGTSPITRLTPEVVFPEIEGWPETAYTSPWPLSERLYLTAWGHVTSPQQGKLREPNDMGLYLYDAASGQLELLYRDADYACEWPMPVTERETPPVLASPLRADAAKEGAFLIADVYKNLKTVKPGDIKSVRVVAVPAKTHPTMNFPNMGIMNDDPGKCVLGTAPVEPDGSAHFRVPAGVTLFFQALDAKGVAVQTMRGAMHVQPGQTVSCIGCHEHRLTAPPSATALVAAARREPSKLTPGPVGSWPLRFDRLVQPVLDRKCVRCHNPQGEPPQARHFDLTGKDSYKNLWEYGTPSLQATIRTNYAQGFSSEGAGPAATSPLLALLQTPKGHYGVKLDAPDTERLITWLDTYGQRLGAFSDEQERDLENLRRTSADLLAAR